MGLADFSSLFSRSFLIGFLAPAMGGLFLLSQWLSHDWRPHGYTAATSATQVIIVATGGIFAALLLSGLQFPLLRLLEGYPFARLQKAPLVGRAYAWRLRRWTNEFDELTAALQGPAGPERSKAALRLNRNFPAKRDSVLVTAFGNVLRSFETHPRKRYGLDGIAIWPRIEMLLDEQEREELEMASTDMVFFINLMAVCQVVGLILAADAAATAPSTEAAIVRCVAVLLATFVVTLVASRASIGAGQRWGSSVRASYDLHRLELFEKLGVKVPMTAEEDEAIGRVVNRLLLYAEPIPGSYRAVAKVNEEQAGNAG
jgi:hypothetical protein